MNEARLEAVFKVEGSVILPDDAGFESRDFLRAPGEADKPAVPGDELDFHPAFFVVAEWDKPGHSCSVVRLEAQLGGLDDGAEKGYRVAFEKLRRFGRRCRGDANHPVGSHVFR